MIHINLTPNTEEGWADKVLKTNLWPINLDRWAALKASENEIFFVEDDVEPNTEGQFNDIPTKLELRTNDLCTHLINKSLLKPHFGLKSLIYRTQHQPHTLLTKSINFGQNL